ncbi:MAG: flavodoxin family protein [Anaerolineae bacterium]|jgi:NAD(P)H-dependent FMN reductase
MTRPVRALGFAGSPRRGGNTEIMLDRFLSGAAGAGAEVEKLVVSDLNLRGCIGCDSCWEQDRCCLTDDFERVNRLLIESDVVALASPLYFLHVPAQVKALVDRGQRQWARQFVRAEPLPPTAAGRQRRRGVLLSAGGSPNPDFCGIVQTVRAFFDVYNIDYWDDLLYKDVDAKGAIEEHATALQEAFDLGVEAVKLD